MNYDYGSLIGHAVWLEMEKWEDRKGADFQPPAEWARTGVPGVVHAAIRVGRKHGDDERASNFRRLWMSTQTVPPPPRRLLDLLQNPRVQVDRLPQGSFFLELPFRLRQALLTKDEVGLYPNENPLRKDRALQVPVFAASSWKGCLAMACWELLSDDPGSFEKAGGSWSRRGAMVRLFGSDRRIENPEGASQGRLQFYPTVFDPASLGYHVINPHDRRTKVGMPIEMETVKKNSVGTFRLLYHAPVQSDAGEVAEDMRIVYNALRRLLWETGFGAKTSSGFGVASVRFPAPGSLAANGRVIPLPTVRALGEAVAELSDIA